MRSLVFLENSKVVTDSLTVAEVFSKRHADVIRDIEVQLNKLNEAGEQEFGKRNFALSSYSSGNREYKKYNLTEEAFTIVAMSYVTPEAMKMKVRFIQEFKRMQQELMKSVTPSYMIEDDIERAKRWIEEREEKRLLETKNVMLEQRVAEYEPKITYLDQIMQSKSTVTITQIAKDYGLSGQQLNKILKEEKIQYKLNDQWLLYSQYHDKGYTKSHTIDVQHSDGSTSVKMNTRWTQKGRLFIHQLLEKRGIIAVIDRNQAS